MEGVEEGNYKYWVIFFSDNVFLLYFYFVFFGIFVVFFLFQFVVIFLFFLSIFLSS